MWQVPCFDFLQTHGTSFGELDVTRPASADLTAPVGHPQPPSGGGEGGTGLVSCGKSLSLSFFMDHWTFPSPVRISSRTLLPHARPRLGGRGPSLRFAALVLRPRSWSRVRHLAFTAPRTWQLLPVLVGMVDASSLPSSLFLRASPSTRAHAPPPSQVLGTPEHSAPGPRSRTLLRPLPERSGPRPRSRTSLRPLPKCSETPATAGKGNELLLADKQGKIQAIVLSGLCRFQPHPG